jgi:hypothetical protein
VPYDVSAPAKRRSGGIGKRGPRGVLILASRGAEDRRALGAGARATTVALLQRDHPGPPGRRQAH